MSKEINSKEDAMKFIHGLMDDGVECFVTTFVQMHKYVTESCSAELADRIMFPTLMESACIIAAQVSKHSKEQVLAMVEQMWDKAVSTQIVVDEGDIKGQA